MEKKNCAREVDEIFKRAARELRATGGVLCAVSSATTKDGGLITVKLGSNLDILLATTAITLATLARELNMSDQKIEEVVSLALKKRDEIEGNKMLTRRTAKPDELTAQESCDDKPCATPTTETTEVEENFENQLEPELQALKEKAKKSEVELFLTAGKTFGDTRHSMVYHNYNDLAKAASFVMLEATRMLLRLGVSDDVVVQAARTACEFWKDEKDKKENENGK